MNGDDAPLQLAAEYFDGRSARAHAVTLVLHGRTLLIRGAEVEREVTLEGLRWPERQRHGARRIELADGGTLRCADAAAFDAFARAAGAADSLTVRAQQSWRFTALAALLLLLAVAAGYHWGVPAAARGVVALVPVAVDERIGESAYQSLQSWLLRPTQVPQARQRELQLAFEQALRRGHSAAAAPPRLRFHAAKGLGPNAFALPGGIVVVTDELLQRLPGRDDVLLGVLAHEYGHVRHRHGMRLLVQVTLLGAVTSIAFGDFSGLLAGVPVLLGQMGYSRDFERQADDDAIGLLRANGISPDVMIALFEALARSEPHGAASAPQATPPPREAASAPARIDDSGLGIAFSSHPADAERIARFRAAAAAR